MNRMRILPGILAVMFLLPLSLRGTGAATAVTVVVNGTPVNFDQPPIERVGRVFVPLRGVFEKLGASVVYEGGLINATGNGHEISLQIGSNTATVDGRSASLDTAPFLAGSRTLVPLRFISQALGADVKYDEGSDTVSITSHFPVPHPALPPPMPKMPVTSRLTLRARSPARATSSSHPSVAATFSETVDPNSVRIQLDGRDVEQNAYVSTTRFQFETPALPPGPHTVRVMGRTSRGASFDQSWSFTSGNSTVANYINGLRPAPGQTVSSDFTVSGITLPNSTVKVAVAGNTDALGGIFKVGIGTFENTIRADANGRFSTSVHIPAVEGGSADVFIQSTAPSGVTTTRRYSLKT